MQVPAADGSSDQIISDDSAGDFEPALTASWTVVVVLAAGLLIGGAAAYGYARAAIIGTFSSLGALLFPKIVRAIVSWGGGAVGRSGGCQGAGGRPRGAGDEPAGGRRSPAREYRR
ncbi:hypothetical protein ACIBG5_21150 [Kribbella sp. NPDC050241]|uniref:hypothetical protein n=1 Tax=Kribbella sp. NPDC050241 TaxID=3364115 RepID=UPI00379B5AF3